MTNLLEHETVKKLPNLTDELITKISKSWDEPYRKQGLKILNTLKNSLPSQFKLLKKAHPLSEPGAVLKPLKVRFSFEECNIPNGEISALSDWIEKSLIKKLNAESKIISFQCCHYDYSPGNKETEIEIGFSF